jgi:multidrug efflux pump subunit AcrA (membrane-fusion protein)
MAQQISQTHPKLPPLKLNQTASVSREAAGNDGSQSNSAPQIIQDSLLTVSGYIINRERIELSPRFMGVVKVINVKKGDAVKKGQIVAILDDAEYQAQLLQGPGFHGIRQGSGSAS